MRVVLDPWVKIGRSMVQNIRAKAEFDRYYYNQFLACHELDFLFRGGRVYLFAGWESIGESSC
ncbi:hypothetical protein KSP40_PGU013517 [Platanthera guangdongensis]|uniref:Uncharacterized protein n=1 Tax=Platanthera guangdongensis TaxID=2320717 RepID=A0ABR2LI76_9ASPA